MNDDLTLLASAYLDGDVTAAERAQVETSPELLAEVERLRMTRALVGDLEPAPISQRERHLAAALDAWDRLPVNELAVGDDPSTGAVRAAAASVSAPTPLDRRRSRRRAGLTTWLAGAAAAIFVVGGGGVALQTLGSNDDDSTTVEIAAEPLAEPESEVGLNAERAADDMAGDAADDAPTEAAPATDAPLAAGDAAPAVADSPPPDADLPALETEVDLRDFVATAEAARQQTTSGGTEAPPSTFDAGFALCNNELGVDFIVGPALFRGEQIVVGLDEGRDLIVVYRDQQCELVTRVAR